MKRLGLGFERLGLGFGPQIEGLGVRKILESLSLGLVSNLK